MTIEHVVAFNLALVAAILSPGPALLVAMQSTLEAGRRAGVAAGVGLGLMAATWTLVALLGLEAVFHYVPWAYIAAKTAGAVYLLYIAYRMWVGASRQPVSKRLSVENSFRTGILINALNPKSVLFAAAVLLVVLPSVRSSLDNVLIVFNHLVVEIVFYTGLAYAVGTTAFRTRYLGAKLYVDRLAACVLGLLGVRLLLSR